jgi:hypothetical protein
MRLLKKKIILALKAKPSMESSSMSMSMTSKSISKKSSPKTGNTVSQRKRIPGCPKLKYSNRCLKNVAKNYGRAICNFILSDIADPYFPLQVEGKSVDIRKFRELIKERKNKLDGIEDFRDLLLIKEEDSEEMALYKTLFKILGEIFVKYFSVNWICSGRLNYKMEYLKVRNKVLRRIRNPELFTYIR